MYSNNEYQKEIVSLKQEIATLRSSSSDSESIIDREKYQGIFQESITAIYLFDSNKVFVDSNQAGLDLLGYPREELIGMSITEVDADVEIVRPAHKQLLAGDRIINYEHRLVRKDGRIITVLNNSRPLTNTEGDVTGLLSTLIDITERKLIQSQRLKTLDETGKVRKRLESLLSATSDVQKSKSERAVIETVARTVQKTGWESVALVLLKDWKIVHSAYVGLDKDEIDYLLTIRPNQEQLESMFSDAHDVYKISKSYFVPTECREKFAPDRTFRKSRKKKVTGDTWDEYDNFYIPLYGLEGEVIGILLLDDPIDRQRPNEHTLKYLEWFSGLAATTICKLRMSEESRITEQALLESESRFEKFKNTIDVAIYRYDPVENCHDFISPSFESQTGYTLEELAADPSGLVRRITHEDDVDRVFRDVELHIQKGPGAGPIITEYRMTHKDGHIVWVSDTKTFEFSERGHLSRINGVVTDITERKKIEEALRASEEQYRAYIQNSPIGIFVMDYDGNFIEANTAACKIKGYSREELLKLNAIDMSPPETRDEAIELFKQIQQDGKYSGELLTLCGDGTRRWVALDIITLKSGNFLGFDRDIHENKLAADVLKRRDAILQAVTFMAEGVLTSDSWKQHIGEVLQLLGEAAQVSRTYVFQNHLGDDGILMTSQKYEWVSGGVLPEIENPKLQNIPLENSAIDRWAEVFSRNELIDGLVKDFPEIERKVLEPQGIKSIVAAPIFVENKLWGFIEFDDNKSERIWASAEIEAIKTVAATLSTAIEYDLAQEALRQNEQDLKTLVDSNPDHVTIYRSDGMILDVVAPDSWQHHISSKHVKGNYITEAHTPEFAKMIQEKIDATLSTEQSQALEFDVSDNGGKCYYESRYVISGSNTVVATLRNMTQLKMLEQEVLKVQKLESLGALAGGIAHDFNNILTGVLGNISLALTEPDDFALIAEYLAESEKAIMRAKGLTQQLLTFSSGGKPIKKIASINELLQESVPFAIRGSNCKAEYDLDPVLYHAKIDTGQLRQVIHNIVLNALQAMPEGGTVRVATECIVKDKVAGPHLTPGKYVRIIISDAGTGISPENIRRIYDPYFTTKQAGSGLGLASSYSVLQQHGGCIEVESELGVGSSFTIDLPATDISPEEVMLSQDEVNEGQGRILVMDDEKTICDLAKKILLKVGYNVDCVCDGDEALRLYKESLARDEKYDVVILDLTIPGGKGGKQTMLELCMIDPEVNAIVCSGYSNDPVMAESSEWGFKGVVTKPFKPQELIKAVQSVMTTNERS